MFKRRGSTPVNENKVQSVLETLKNQPGGVLEVSQQSLSQLAQGMEPQDFAALKLDLADAQWQARNVDRLNQPGVPPPARYRLRPWP